MKRLCLALGLLLVISAPLPADDVPGFVFRDGDRIVFLGDSITEQYQYSSTIELYLTTRFPSWKLTFLNAGIGGDTATGGAGRFASHVLAEKPTMVTINFGMNDGGYGAFDRKRQEGYVSNTAKMLDLAKKAGARVALMSPNAVDRRVAERFKLYLETQKEFYAPLKQLAVEHGAFFADQYAVTRKALEEMEKKDPEAKTVRPFGDGFHTSPSGGLLMAHAILTRLGAPSLVSDVRIDAKAKKAAVRACKVENLTASEQGVSFERADEALPLPLAKDWLPYLPYMNDLEDLNFLGLQVSGLAEGKYALTIDGQEAGTWTAAQLDEGVNLGNLTTGPIHAQASKVFAAINDKNSKLVAPRFRDVVRFQVNLPDWLADLRTAVQERRPKELAQRMEKIDERQAEIYKLAQPQPHRFELKPAK